MDIVEKMIAKYTIPKFPDNPSEAMSYVPFQQEITRVYAPVQALSAGTVFPELNKPFCGGKCGGVNDD